MRRSGRPGRTPTLRDVAAPAAIDPSVVSRVLNDDITLKARGGVVINVASIAGHRAFAGRANHCAAKAGVVMLTQVLAQEWATDGIRVLAVSTGFVATDMVVAGIEGAWVSQDAIRARTPMDRLADPDEIARAIIALAGGSFSYATGAAVSSMTAGWRTAGSSTRSLGHPAWPAVSPRGCRAPRR